MEKKKSKKGLKAIGIVLLVLVVAVGAWLAFHHIYGAIERNRSYPGQLVATENGKLHVYVEENTQDGPTYVFLDAFGGGSAYYDFKVLWSELGERANIVTIDYLGYGISNDTKAPRTIGNISGEIAAVLDAIELDGPFTLVAHSAGGFYASAYALEHPEKVAAMVMIDTTPPGMGAFSEEELDYYRAEHKKYSFLRFTGLNRFDPIEVWLPGVTDEEAKIYSMYYMHNYMSAAIVSEAEHMGANSEFLVGQVVSAEIPMLRLVGTANQEWSIEEGWELTWEELAEAYLSGHEKSEVVMLEAGHYIHWEIPEQVIAQMEAFGERLAE